MRRSFQLQCTVVQTTGMYLVKHRCFSHQIIYTSIRYSCLSLRDVGGAIAAAIQWEAFCQWYITELTRNDNQALDRTFSHIHVYKDARGTRSTTRFVWLVFRWLQRRKMLVHNMTSLMYGPVYAAAQSSCSVLKATTTTPPPKHTPLWQQGTL